MTPAQSQKIIDQITTAFQNTPYPGDDDLTVHPLGLDEVFYDAIRGQKWQDLDPALLRYHQDCVGLLTPRGFQYYLPAFLIADLREPSVIGEMLIINLSMCIGGHDSIIKGVSGPDWIRERFSILTSEQRSALLEFCKNFDEQESVADEDTQVIIKYLSDFK